ncbi:N-acetylneuraminate synthase family protein, partial [Chloroflexota bacterium]
MSNLQMTYILAEMAASHEGKPEIAEIIITAAAEGRADGILFQIFNLDAYIVPSDEDYENLKKWCLDPGEWQKLIEKANSLGLDVWANVYDLASMELCRDSMIKGFKLHSSNLENEELLGEVVKLQKALQLSVGGMGKEEIQKTLSLVHSIDQKARLHLMYGLQNFPTNPEGINLNFISELSEELNIPFGYQDHSEPTSSFSSSSWHISYTLKYSF